MFAWATLLVLTSPAAGPVVPSPTLNVGDEVVYAGQWAEEIRHFDRPSKRRWAVRVRVFALDVRPGSTDLAVLTQLRALEDPNVAEPAATITGTAPSSEGPPAVRLDLIRLEANGRMSRLMPSPQPPLVLKATTPTAPLSPMPFDRPADLELGAFVPLPDRRPTIGDTWEVNETGRPPMKWTVARSAHRDGATALELTGEQSPPTAAARSTRRTETVSVSPVDGLARRFERVIEQSIGGSVRERRTLTCEMVDPPTPHRGGGYQAIRREIEFALGFQADLAAGRTSRLSAKIDEFKSHHRETPYRVAIDAVARQLPLGP